MRRLIRELGGGPRTIVLSSHDMDEAVPLWVDPRYGGRHHDAGLPGGWQG